MRALHLVFQLHQPYSLKVPEGGEHEYFGGGADFREANQKYYQPFFALLERNTQRHPGLKVSLLVSGTWLEQAELYEPELVRRLQKLVDLGQVELVATPYYYSLAAFYDKDEFAEQVALFRQKFEGKFSTKCEVFAAPGLMYHDKLAKWAEKAGFRGALAGDGAEVLGFRNAGKVYDVAGCEDFRVLFENGRMSQDLMRGGDLVMAESPQMAEDFAEDEDGAAESSGDFDGDGVRKFGGNVAFGGNGARAFGANGVRKRATAAEFVRGRAGMATAAAERSAGAVRQRAAVGKKMYSAKKLQKELEMACLRGNLVSLCLDARMFGVQREKGVVACFDEFFMNWLKVPGNKFLTAREVFEAEAFKPTAEISVKTTVRSRGMLTGGESVTRREDACSVQSKGVSSARTDKDGSVQSKGVSLARMEEVQFTLPDRFRTAEEDRLYGLRERVLKTKNEDLYSDFRKLSAMDYAFGEFQEDFGKVLEDFEARVEVLSPKPKRLRAENTSGEADLEVAQKARNGVSGEEEPEPENDYTVKVHRILKKASAEQQAQAEQSAHMENFAGWQGGFTGQSDGVVDGFAGESGDFVGRSDGAADEDTDEWLEGFALENGDIGGAGAMNGDEMSEGNDEGGDFADIMDEFDAVEAEVQVIAQRMKRSRQTAERELEALLEAEVVPGSSSKAKTVSGLGTNQKDGRGFGTGPKVGQDEGRKPEEDAKAGIGAKLGLKAKKKKTRRRIVLD